VIFSSGQGVPSVHTRRGEREGHRGRRNNRPRDGEADLVADGLHEHFLQSDHAAAAPVVIGDPVVAGTPFVWELSPIRNTAQIKEALNVWKAAFSETLKG
jgi:hypothetical protein